MTKEALCRLAVAATKNAYAPYSDFCVGAAILADSGKVYTGCNVENASFSVTNCAERTALFSAVAAGERSFSALAVAGGKNGVIDGVCLPCGVCLQALSEFCKPETDIYLVKKDGFDTVKLSDLLPSAFKLN